MTLGAGDAVDCLVIGGGPAGLMAATYLARFRLTALVCDSGESRAAQIPCTRNQPGFPDGIAGAELLGRMRQQASRFGVEHRSERVAALAQAGRGFTAQTGAGEVHARSVLLATGVYNRRPAMETEIHDEAVARGKLRYCPICDGYEVSGQGVAVIGTGQHAANEAVFLRAFTRRIVLLAPDGAHQLEQGTRRDLQAAGIELLDGPVSGFALEAGQITFQSGALRLGADSVYLALGSVVRSELAGSLGVERSDEGCIKVDSHQRTCVPGLYAAGDVVLGLDQISIAVGEAALAATTIRNDLHDRGRRLP